MRSTFLRRLLQHRLAALATLFLVVITFASVFAPYLTPYAPDEMDFSRGGLPTPPSRENWFGTDELGRDYFTRVLYGGRVSLSVGFVSAAISAGVGTLVGLVSGFFGGIVDQVLMRLVDILLSIPSLLLMIGVNALLEPSLWSVILVIGFLSWMDAARLVRSQVLSLRAQDYVLAAESMGAKPWSILFRHLLPNCLPIVFVATSFNVGQAILVESSLSFLGLGIQPPQTSWGSLLQQAQSYMSGAIWLGIFPGAFIGLTVVGLNLLGDSIRDHQDPRHLLRRSS